jgi:hypothetical protein
VQDIYLRKQRGSRFELLFYQKMQLQRLAKAPPQTAQRRCRQYNVAYSTQSYD